MSEPMPERFRVLFREHDPIVLRKMTALISDRAAAAPKRQEPVRRLLRRTGSWLPSLERLKSRLSD
jgi:hypothetical protein